MDARSSAPSHIRDLRSLVQLEDSEILLPRFWPRTGRSAVTWKTVDAAHLARLKIRWELEKRGIRRAEYADFTEDSALTELVSATCASGFFQDWNVVSPVLPSLLHKLVPQVHAGVPIPQDAIVVHVRRGDYLQLENLGVLPDEYYGMALRALGATARDRVIVVSDAPIEAVQMLSRSGFRAMTFDSGSLLGDFSAVLSAERVVIANSTFSWWAATFGTALHPQQVVAPDPWFAKIPMPKLSRPGWKWVPSGF